MSKFLFFTIDAAQHQSHYAITAAGRLAAHVVLFRSPCTRIAINYHAIFAAFRPKFLLVALNVKTPTPSTKVSELSELKTNYRGCFRTKKFARFDKDTDLKATVDERYDELKNGEIDIIIGTQVIAKGLDLPHLTVVGVFRLTPDFPSLTIHRPNEHFNCSPKSSAASAGQARQQKLSSNHTNQVTHPSQTDYLKTIQNFIKEPYLSGKKLTSTFTYLLNNCVINRSRRHKER